VARYRTRIDPSAASQLEEIASWWAENRLDARDLVVTEFEKIVECLEAAPLAIGTTYGETRRPNVRRALMLRTNYHVYYTIDESSRMVRILALWHGRRSGGPRL
jgi:plasmid stabilization system protein ParE